MAISGILSTAVSGLALASSRVAASADNIANVNSPGFQAREIQSSSIVTRGNTETGFAPGGVRGVLRTSTGQSAVAAGIGSNVDITSELVTLIEAENAYKAGVEVIRTGTRLSRDLLNIKA